ncbi:MAG: hypothetical protein H0W22_06120, partial [Chloroflexi bacterium]|nr:hypothetical protein [Chloroflexota bacterium]
MTPTKAAPPPSPPAGTLFFVHGANETSEGLSANLSRIEDEVRKRGWDVRVVAPEWRRQSGLRLGNWRKALYRRGKPSPIALSSLPTGVGKAAVMKLMTNYFEDRRESMFEALGAQLLADVMGYQQHRASIQDVLKAELTHAADAAPDRPILPVGLSLGG